MKTPVFSIRGAIWLVSTVSIGALIGLGADRAIAPPRWLVVAEAHGTPPDHGVAAQAFARRSCYGRRLGELADAIAGFLDAEYLRVPELKQAARPLMAPVTALNRSLVAIEHEKMLLAAKWFRASADSDSAGSREVCEVANAERFHWKHIRGPTNALLMHLIPAWQGIGSDLEKDQLVARVKGQSREWRRLVATLRGGERRFAGSETSACP